VTGAQRFRAGARGTSEVFGAQERPDEIGKHEGGGGAAEDEIEHGLNLSAKCDETDQQGEDRRGVDNRNDVAHGETPVSERGRACDEAALKCHSETGPDASKPYKKRTFNFSGQMEARFFLGTETVTPSFRMRVAPHSDRLLALILVARGVGQQSEEPGDRHYDENEIEHDGGIPQFRIPH
jgi:hypothetical protein